MPAKQNNRKKTPKSPLETAVLLLTRQPMSRLALEKKLRDKGFSRTVAEETLRECERYGYIDDSRMAEAKVAMMRDRGDGARKIKLHLALKGFSAEIIREALQADSRNAERDELAVALEFLRRRKITLERERDPLKRKLRALRALASKGFGQGVAREAVARVFGNTEFEFPEDGEAL